MEVQSFMLTIIILFYYLGFTYVDMMHCFVWMHLGTNGPTAQIRTAVGVEKQVQFNTIFQLLNEREKVSFGRFHLYTTPAGIFVQRLVSWKCAFFLHEICCESSLSKACVTS